MSKIKEINDNLEITKAKVTEKRIPITKSLHEERVVQIATKTREEVKQRQGCARNELLKQRRGWNDTKDISEVRFLDVVLPQKSKQKFSKSDDKMDKSRSTKSSEELSSLQVKSEDKTCLAVTKSSDKKRKKPYQGKRVPMNSTNDPSFSSSRPKNVNESMKESEQGTKSQEAFLIRHTYQRQLAINGRPLHNQNERPADPVLTEMLSTAIIQNNFDEFINHIQRHPSCINFQLRATGMTALMAAAEIGDFRVVSLLLARGANPQLRDIHGLSALDYARMADKMEQVGWLLTDAEAQKWYTNDSHGTNDKLSYQAVNDLEFKSSEEKSRFFEQKTGDAKSSASEKTEETIGDEENVYDVYYLCNFPSENEINVTGLDELPLINIDSAAPDWLNVLESDTSSEEDWYDFHIPFKQFQSTSFVLQYILI